MYKNPYIYQTLLSGPGLHFINLNWIRIPFVFSDEAAFALKNVAIFSLGNSLGQHCGSDSSDEMDPGSFKNHLGLEWVR